MALLLVKSIGTALAINYGSHLASSLAYSKICVPQGIWDLAKSLATTASPVCSTILNIMQITQNNYAIVMTTTVVTGLTTFFNK
jgi:hypothetical protein